MTETYYKFRDCEYDWKAFFLLHENCLIETACSWLCNKTLSEIYRLLFFIPDVVYEEDFKFNRLVQKAIERVASEQKFDCFDKNPPEVSDGKICVWEY